MEPRECHGGSLPFPREAISTPSSDSFSCSLSAVRNSRTTPDGGAAGNGARSVQRRPVECGGRRMARFPEITTSSGVPGAPGRGAKDAGLAVTGFPPMRAAPGQQQQID